MLPDWPTGQKTSKVDELFPVLVAHIKKETAVAIDVLVLPVV